MIENIINFAKVNPWTMGFTLLSLFVFVIMIFLINGKKNITQRAKLEAKGLNIFMLLIVCIFIGFIAVIASTPGFSTLINENHNSFVYWFFIIGIWVTVEYITGIDPTEILE